MGKKLKALTNKTIHWVQKLTGTDVVYIAKYGSYLTLGNIISLAASFLLSIAFARLLPKETYGDYRYVLSIFELLAISSLQGLNGVMVQGIAQGFDGVAKAGLKTKLKWSSLGSVASLIIGAYFWIKGNSTLLICFLIIAAFLPLVKGSELYQSVLDGKKMFDKRAKYSIIIQIFYTICIAITIFLTKKLILIIFIYFLSIALIRTYFLFKTFKKYLKNNSNDPKFIVYGKHTSVIGIIGIVSQQVSNILLFQLVGPVQLAIYSFATLPVDNLRTPLQTIQELALPKLATRPADEIKRNLPKKLLKISILILLGIGVYILIVPYFFQIFFPQYLSSIPYSRLYSFDLLVFPMSMMTLALYAKMKTKELYKVNIINPIFQILITIILIPLYGIMGAIIARLLSNVFYFFLAYFFFKKI